MRRLLYKFISYIFLAYLRIIKITGRLVIEDENFIKEDSMVGYWHGDSFCMLLVLEKMSKIHKTTNIIVTADKRGDIIEGMINSFGARALRLPDGMKMRQHFKKLMEFSKEEDGILATSLDGPLGPLHSPKKLIFVLAAEAGRQVAYVHFEYRRVLRLKHRWDNYVIPLPFSKITAVVEELGTISREDVRNFAVLKDAMKH